MSSDSTARSMQDLFGWVSTSPTQSEPCARPFSVENTTPPGSDLSNFQSECAQVTTTGSVHELGNGGFTAVVGSPIWEQAELAEKARNCGQAAAFSRAYTLYGRGFLAHVRGPFSFAIFDKDQGRLLAGVDRIGQHALYYSVDGARAFFGMNAGELLASSTSKATLSNQGVYDYVYFHMVPSPQSVYQGLKKLPAAHCIQFDGGQLDTFRYWTPDFRKDHKSSLVDLGGKLKEQLREAVERALEKTVNPGTFLSGGLDSSTVTGMLAEITGGDRPAYAIGFEEEGYDEMAFARETAKHFGVTLHEYYVTPQDVLDELPTIAGSYDEPFGNSSALPAYFCAKRAAADGVDCLLAGDGGDEIFAGNERYARQRVFNIYSKIPQMLRDAIVEPLVSGLPSGFPLAPKAKSYISKANTPLPDRLQDHNFLHVFSPKEIFSEDFLREVDLEQPLALLRDTYWSPVDASELDRMLYMDWQYTLADNDLRKVSKMCTLAGIDVRYPMLDPHLIDFSCSIPDNFKLKHGSLRHFYKKSLRGWLPDVTIDKKKHGFGLPFGLWMQRYKPLSELAYDSVLRLKDTGYFQADFLNRIIQLHRTDHATYYGELIWILTILDLWLQGRDSR